MPRTCENEYVLELENANFKNLEDTPNSYAGQGGRVVTVKNTEDGLEFTTGGTGGVESFKNLNDTPISYSGQSGKVVTVNSTEDGLEFTTGGTASLNKLISTNTITSIKILGANGFTLTIPNIQTDGFVTGMTIVGETSGAIAYASAIYSDNTIRIHNPLFNNTPFIVGEKISEKLYPVSITDLFGVDKTIETTDEGNILQLKKNVDEKLVYTNVPDRKSVV